MPEDDSALDEDLGEATVVYEGPDGEPIEREIPNEHVAYFQDHWILKTGTDEEGRDTIRRVPAQRVYYVERTVDEFEEEVKTIKDRVESLADDLRTLVPGKRHGEEEQVYHIDVDSGEQVEKSGNGDPTDERGDGPGSSPGENR